MIEEQIKVYQAFCHDCTKMFSATFDEWRAERQAENHAMETGHIVYVEVI